MIGLLLACAAPAPVCADGMVEVPTPAGAPRTCIDAWEVSVSGTLGPRDDPHATPAAEAHATPGVLPTVGISWAQAAAVCAVTAVRDPRTGQLLGSKHLATTREWEDAGDGVAGPGGPRYPWGDTPAPGRCGLVPPAGPPPGASLQPAGSFPGCVGPTGAADLLGNAWEWVDSGIRMDLGTWVRGATGLVKDGDTLRVAGPAHLPGYAVTVPNFGGHLEVGPGAELLFVADRPGAGPEHGYLVHQTGRSLAELQAPVVLTPDAADPTRHHLALLTAWDGATFPEKRGGAWYAGGDFDLHTPSWQHTPDFVGTIGFRCAGPALPP